MSIFACSLMAGGAALVSRPFCILSRGAGAFLVGAGVLIMSAPAVAQDQTLMAVDNAEVNCTVSAKGLTRISLKDDRFASISKMTTGIGTEDFTVVNEPTRGDIYISIPDGFSRAEVAFFGTTAKGFTYKFACRPQGERAHQVFVHNKTILIEQPAEAARRASPSETSIALVQAMYAQLPLDGFELRQPEREPVMVGSLKVQMISEYRGLELAGRVLRIENKGKQPTSLEEGVIAPTNAIAVSVAKSTLKPGEATTAYIVTKIGAAQ